MAEGINISDHEKNINPASAPLWLVSGQACFAGWVAGAAGVAVGHPFDTIKTLQQTQTTSKSSIHCLRMLKTVWSGYGVKGLYRGLTYPLITYGAVNSAFFCGSEYAKSFMYNQSCDGNRKLAYSQVFLAGCMGGVAQIAVVTPSELVKIKMQDQINTGRKLYTGSVDCTRKLWRTHGFFEGFYKGLSATVLRDIYAWGFYLLCFEYTRDKMSHSGLHYIISELIAGGLAGTGSWMLATPFDVIKSRMQASDHPVRLIPVIKSLYKEAGLRAFTRGIFVSGIRGFPSNAVTLFGFAELSRIFQRINKENYG